MSGDVCCIRRIASIRTITYPVLALAERILLCSSYSRQEISSFIRGVGVPFASCSFEHRIHSSLQAFYVPNKDRKNLSVLVTATVRKVLTTTSSNGNVIATGVEFEYNGTAYDVNAKKEVIVSSG